VTYGTKVYGMGYVALAFLLAAIGVGFFVRWWLAAPLGLLALAGFIITIRIGRSGTEAERRALTDAGERAFGASGRALGGGWNPRGGGDPEQ
jgi:hypothetical protein